MKASSEQLQGTITKMGEILDTLRHSRTGPDAKRKLHGALGPSSPLSARLTLTAEKQEKRRTYALGLKVKTLIDTPEDVRAPLHLFVSSTLKIGRASGRERVCQYV